MRRIYFAVAALALIALLAIAGCGGGGGTTSPSASGGGQTTGTTTESGATTTAESSGGTTTTESGGTTTSSTPEIEEEAAAVASEGGGAATGATQPAVVKVMNTSKLGKVIVDAEGMTMYDFHKDKGNTSSCYGACAEAWPPLLTKGMPTATGGAEASLIGVTKRKDGTEQVTYDGHPLYGFIEDQKPGETNGNDVSGFGAQWYALLPNGEEPEDS
jgi:predicted lipoprotein with Yx(FWY)xxD motif